MNTGKLFRELEKAVSEEVAGSAYVAEFERSGKHPRVLLRKAGQVALTIPVSCSPRSPEHCVNQTRLIARRFVRQSAGA